MLQTKCALTLRGSRNDKLVSRCRRFNRPDFCRICCFLPFPLLGDVWLPSRSFQSRVLCWKYTLHLSLWLEDVSLFIPKGLSVLKQILLCWRSSRYISVEHLGSGHESCPSLWNEIRHNSAPPHLGRCRGAPPPRGGAYPQPHLGCRLKVGLGFKGVICKYYYNIDKILAYRCIQR